MCVECDATLIRNLDRLSWREKNIWRFGNVAVRKVDETLMGEKNVSSEEVVASRKLWREIREHVWTPIKMTTERSTEGRKWRRGEQRLKYTEEARRRWRTGRQIQNRSRLVLRWYTLVWYILFCVLPLGDIHLSSSSAFPYFIHWNWHSTIIWRHIELLTINQVVNPCTTKMIIFLSFRWERRAYAWCDLTFRLLCRKPSPEVVAT